MLEVRYKKKQIPPVPQHHTRLVSLVMAMYGYPGQYGIKETAEAFLPPLE